MNKGRFLHEEKIKDHSNLGVYGIFSTTKVEWKYYVISYSINSSSNKVALTSELCGYTQEATFETISRQGKEYKTVDDAKKFIQDYKVKWETGSNNTTQEVRAKKLDDILDSDK
jgi:hypothetical protein